jgi:hypothetical protein
LTPIQIQRECMRNRQYHDKDLLLKENQAWNDLSVKQISDEYNL